MITVASAALQFALRLPRGIVSRCANRLSRRGPAEVGRRSHGGWHHGHDERHPFSETMELALNLHPSAKRVFVVAQSPSVEGYDERIRSALNRFSDRVELMYIKARTVPALLAAVKAIPPPSVHPLHPLHPETRPRISCIPTRLPASSWMRPGSRSTRVTTSTRQRRGRRHDALRRGDWEPCRRDRPSDSRRHAARRTFRLETCRQRRPSTGAR